MLARLLCWFGFHRVVVTHPGHRSQHNTAVRDSALGFCVRCNLAYQWDV